MECDSVRIHARLQVCRLKREKFQRSCGDRLRPPAQFEVRAAILAANGHEEVARGDANNLGAEDLLPEERALIAPLLGDQR
jgi:hypothetical protein